MHTLPLRELEHTYGYKLYRTKAAAYREDGPNSELMIEVGRFFKDLARAIADSPIRSSPLIETKAKFSLAALYRRCKARGVLDTVHGPAEKQVMISLQKIWTVLHTFNHVAFLPQSLPTTLDGTSLGVFVLDALDQWYSRDGAPNNVQKDHPHMGDAHFLPKELCFKTLTELGGLKIKWTKLYTQHLRLDRRSKSLIMFWDVSILGQSPLFAHWPQWLEGDHPAATSQILRDYSVGSFTMLEELKRSYRVIFGNPNARFLDRFFRKHFGHGGDDAGIELKDLELLMRGSGITRVDIMSRSSARQALEYYLRAPIPTSILELRPELDRKKHRGPGKGLNLHVYLKRPTSGKLMDLLKAGPPFPLDFWMHISSLLELS